MDKERKAHESRSGIWGIVSEMLLPGSLAAPTTGMCTTAFVATRFWCYRLDRIPEAKGHKTPDIGADTCSIGAPEGQTREQLVNHMRVNERLFKTETSTPQSLSSATETTANNYSNNDKGSAAGVTDPPLPGS